MRPILVPFVLGCALVCGAPGCATEPIGDADREGFRSAVAAFYEGVEEGNAEQVIRLFADEAILMPDGYAPLRGKEQIAATWRRGVEGGFRIRGLVALEESVGESIAYRLNSYEWTMLSEGEAAEWRPTKNVHIWRRQSDGNWKLEVDLWNENPRQP